MMTRTLQRLIRVMLISLILIPVSSAQQSSDTQTLDSIDADKLNIICDAATPAPQRTTESYPAAAQVLEVGVDYSAVFCTSAGAIFIDLFEDQTPITVNNMVFLAHEGFYNNTIFHRVIENFMAQGGDPTGSGTGGPGYQFQDEFVDDLRFDRPYLLAMANAGPATNGSQFFITFAPTSWLNDAFTIFGEVSIGQEAVDNILYRDPLATDAPATALHTVVILEDVTVADANTILTEPDLTDVAATLDTMCDAVVPAPERTTESYQQAEQVLVPDTDYSAIFCTSEGAIYLDLFENQTPITVNNMVFLAHEGFYNNTIFHRVIRDFMAQGGDPTGSGTGGPGYQFPDEFVDDLRFDRPYLLAMANAGPATNGSQFFITFVPTDWLNDRHTIFGEVIHGQAVVDNILFRDPVDTQASATTLHTIIILDEPLPIQD